jgi:hypothetical protein
MHYFTSPIDIVHLHCIFDTMKQTLKIDVTKTVSQAQYARMKTISRQAVNNKVRLGQLKTVKVCGRIMILID